MPLQTEYLAGSQWHGTNLHSARLCRHGAHGLWSRDHVEGSRVNLLFEFKVMRVRECAIPGPLIDTPESGYQYWISNIPQAAWFDPAKEVFVVLVLNTRRRIIGHNLVALGSLD